MAAQESFAVVIVVGMVLTALLSWCLLVKRCLCRGHLICIAYQVSSAGLARVNGSYYYNGDFERGPV